MKAYREEFIEFLHDCGAFLSDGPYVLKGGRESPYFVDVSKAMADSGKLDKLGGFYLSAVEHVIGVGNFDVIYGLPEKGRVVSAALGQEIFRKYGKPKGLVYARKVPKGHGEGTGRSGSGNRFFGWTPGPTDRFLVVDDVYTQGTALNEYRDLLEAWCGELGVEPAYAAVLVAFDRQESPDDVFSIVTAREAFNHPRTRGELGEDKWKECLDYLNTCGVVITA